MQCRLPIQVLLVIGSVVDSDHFWRALSLLWVAGSSVNLCRDLARAQPGRANILNRVDARSVEWRLGHSFGSLAPPRKMC
jgi:hypothetical protein